jgi:hypothetical protein
VMDIKELTYMLRAWKYEGATLQWRESDTYEWSTVDDSWIVSSIINCIDNRYQMRVKPKTITLPAREIPAPETVAPAEGTPYYMASPHCAVMQSGWGAVWADMQLEKNLLKHGLVYLNKEDAALAGKAMLPFGDEK